MKAIARTWSRETMTEAIREAYDHWKTIRKDATVQDAAQFEQELKALCFIFLEKFIMFSEDVAMFQDLLTDKDAEILLEINRYNHHRLKMRKQ